MIKKIKELLAKISGCASARKLLKEENVSLRKTNGMLIGAS